MNQFVPEPDRSSLDMWLYILHRPSAASGLDALRLLCLFADVQILYDTISR